MRTVSTSHSTIHADHPIVNKVSRVARLLKLIVGIWLLLMLTGLIVLVIGFSFFDIASIHSVATEYPDSTLRFKDFFLTDAQNANANPGGSGEFNLTREAAIYATLFFGSLFLLNVYMVTRLFSLFRNFENKRLFINENVRLLKSFVVSLSIVFLLPYIPKLFFFITAQEKPLTHLSENLWSGSEMFSQIVLVGMALLVYWIYTIARDMYVDAQYTV